MSVAEVEAKIRAAVAEAKAEGWRIRPGIYCFEPLDKSYRQCCPLFACVRSGMTQSDNDVRHKAADYLGIDTLEALDIVYGFDNPSTDLKGDFVRLGVRISDLVDP